MRFRNSTRRGLAELERLILGERLDTVIIDSWTRAMPAMRPGAGVFMGEAEIMQRLTNLAHRLGCLIIVIAHGGKRDAADDPMQMIAATNALPASVDDVLVLFKDGDDVNGTVRRKLFVSGRNIAKPGTYILERHETQAAFVLRREARGDDSARRVAAENHNATWRHESANDPLSNRQITGIGSQQHPSRLARAGKRRATNRA